MSSGPDGIAPFLACFVFLWLTLEVNRLGGCKFGDVSGGGNIPSDSGARNQATCTYSSSSEKLPASDAEKPSLIGPRLVLFPSFLTIFAIVIDRGLRTSGRQSI